MCGGDEVTHASLAREFGTKRETVSRRATGERWAAGRSRFRHQTVTLLRKKRSSLEAEALSKQLRDAAEVREAARAAFGTLHAALRQAVRWHLLSADPSEFVELPRRARTREIKVLDPDQAAAFLEAAKGERLEAFFNLALVTGCRPGELAALRWEDVDVSRGTVAIHRAMSRLRGGKVEFAEPRTDHGFAHVCCSGGLDLESTRSGVPPTQLDSTYSKEN